MLEFAEIQHTDRETLFVEVILPLAISEELIPIVCPFS